MTNNERLRNEAAQTETVLRQAAQRLLQWADALAAAFFESAIPPEEIRQVAHVLAKQGGRLSMAREMAKPKRTRGKA